jgi:excisionase family DNA binding protein
MAEKLISAAEVADMFGVSVGWVYTETRAGRIPHVKLGRYPRYKPSSIERWIAEREAATMVAQTKRPRQRATAPGAGTGE